MGRNFLTPGHPGVRVRNVRGKSGPKNLCLCCFFFPDWNFAFPRVPFGRVAFRRFQSHQQKTPWVDSACADCPGFLVRGAADAPPPPSSRSISLCPWASILLHGPLNICLDLLPAAPPPPIQQVFTAQGRTPKPPRTTQKYEQNCGRKLSIFPCFYSNLGHILSSSFHILTFYVGGGVAIPGIFLRLGAANILGHGVSETSLLIFEIFARFLALTANFWQVNDHQRRQALTMNQSKPTRFRSRNLKGLVFLSADIPAVVSLQSVIPFW